MNLSIPSATRAILAFYLSSSAVLAGTLAFHVRDSRTGYALVATVRYAPAEADWTNPRSSQTDSSGEFRQDVTDGTYLVEISAEGYKTLRTHVSARENPMKGAIMLPPLEDPFEFREERIESQLRDGQTLVLGFVLDADTFTPLRGVEVTASSSRTRVLTNQRGFYSFHVPSSGPNALTDLTFMLTGYGSQVFRNVQIPSGSTTTMRVELKRGGPPTQKDLMHKQLRPPSVELGVRQRSLAVDQEAPALVKSWITEAGAGLSFPKRDQSVPRVVQQAASAVTLPSTIKVGFDCVETACATWQTFDLEEYVRDEEWYSSWHENSLRAGSVAYRTVGAYFVIRTPISTDYDIFKYILPSIQPGWEPSQINKGRGC